jgi:putative hydrolase of the HAD superfamily
MDNNQVTPLVASKEKTSCNVKAIIFDLGNVLIDFDYMIAAQRISQFTDRSANEIFNLFFDSELTALFEEAKVSPLQFFSKVKETFDLRLDYAGFELIWNQIFFFSEKNLSVYNLALNLKRHYKLTFLSNINILHFEYIKKTFPIINAFQFMASCELGLRKPQSQIYYQALKTLGVSPRDCFYTDDRPELIESARGLGIKGFVFRGIEQLKKDLLDAGVNIN